MLFFDYSFLFLFLPLAVLVHARLKPSGRNLWLLVASAVFYSASSFQFLSLLVVSVSVDYIAGGRIARSESNRARKAWLLASLAANLGFLGFFKYAGFITSNIRSLGIDVPIMNVPLPVGISFYTFQSMSYTIDVYRRRVTPARSYVDFAAFVMLFPQLIAGPIVRYSDVSEALVDRSVESTRVASGIVLLVVGMAKKILLADTFADMSEPMFATGSPSLLTAWGSMLLYAGQIYFDFSGYSDMAVGMGRLMGFPFPANFDSPYRAISFSDFWRRWHISLSTWLRDYLYIPLGGNRGGTVRTCINLMLTMLLGGLWHGASWTFVVWGGLHGLFLVVERLAGERNPLLKLPIQIRRVVIFAFVVITWVPFRLPNMSLVNQWWLAMFGLTGVGSLGILPIATLAALVFLVMRAKNTSNWQPEFSLRLSGSIVVLFLATLFVGYGRVVPSPFLYFRF